jgi:hypothetical protein
MSSMLLKKSLCYPLALATVAISTLAQSASAATFNFSFSNVNGSVAGTVQGTITLPDGNGTFAASAVTVTSAPAALGYTTPLPLNLAIGNLAQNTFTVVGGQINAGLSNFFYVFPGNSNAIGLRADSAIFGSSNGLVTFFDSASGGFLGSPGVLNSNNSTLTFTSTAVPEPATVLGLPKMSV